MICILFKIKKKRKKILLASVYTFPEPHSGQDHYQASLAPCGAL